MEQFWREMVLTLKRFICDTVDSHRQRTQVILTMVVDHICSLYSMQLDMRWGLTDKTPPQHVVSPALFAGALSYEGNASHSANCSRKTELTAPNLHRAAGAVKARQTRLLGPRGPVEQTLARSNVDLSWLPTKSSTRSHMSPGAYSNPDK